MNLQIDEKIGQRFIFGINDSNTECILNLIKNNAIGGVILYKKNYHSYDEMVSVIKKIKKANSGNKLPLFIAIDQEGGRVNRMPPEIHNLKNIYDFSLAGMDMVKTSAKLNSYLLRNMGINMNLAPVMDVNTKSKVLYKRCFAGSIDEIGNFGKEYVAEFSKNNIIAVIKHYPGHGVSSFDSHRIIPYIFNYQKVLNSHIIPFANVLKADGDAIMLGHLVIRKLTKLLPASISNYFIDKYLRERYNYDGLIMTDEINMLRYNLIYRFLYLKAALKSKSDIVIVKIKNKKEAKKIIDKYKHIVLTDNNCMNNLDDSVMRIINIKSKYKINDSIDNIGIDLNKINDDIDKLNNKIISQ